MKIIKENIKKGFVTLKIENLDDLWYLSQIIDETDFISGKTLRKIKLESDTRSKKIEKKTVKLKIEVNKIEFHKTSDILRASGKVLEGPEDISLGSHHTFNLENGTIFTLEKKSWLNYQIKRIKEASKESKTKILILVLDRDEATFALLKKYGFDILTNFQGEVERKREKTKTESKFYDEVIKILNQYEKKYNFNHIILASPAFWKENLFKIIKKKAPESAKKIILSTCNSTGENAIIEVLKRKEVQTALKEDRIAKETGLIEELLEEISKDNLAVYGIKEVENAVNSGAVKTLLLTDSLMKKYRTKNFEKLDSLMKNVESQKGEIRIISTEHDAGKKLNGLSGIAAILRYKTY
ncbi:MAG: mRNA surveillance protein pelota [Nanoarchaeota archaeon]|nr:mRNA surveillance protein pelota [Nanoarchaeota archaeon]MBU1444961.1 mRNA surveillance protein pelota [Nanoarchaeota archaeon]MBU2420417.1 mRNA surveillance protein pelota [Nanoarchaeota archaeon]MBU2475715.1 mRNA surveillance protein pelota [Nanoarchaeota archaeon]